MNFNRNIFYFLMIILLVNQGYAQDKAAKEKTAKEKADQLAVEKAIKDLSFDLQNNLNLAHIYQNGLIIDPSNQGIVKYLRDDQKNWSYGHQKDGRAVIMPKSVQARFWVPITAEMAKQELKLEIILKATFKDQKMDLFWDEEKISHEIYDGEWSQKSYKIPADKAKEGLHLIKLHFSKRKNVDGIESPAWVRLLKVSTVDAKDLPTNEVELSKLINTKPLYQTLQLVENQTLEYYINPPKEGVLSGEVKGGVVEILATNQVGSSAKSLGTFKDKISVKLESLKGEASRLIVKHISGQPVLNASIAPTELLLNQAMKPKYVVFWLIDTLRADKLPFYQMANTNKRDKVKTPALSAFAKESSVFEPFYVQGNESKASHASLFTGTYPIKHKVFTHEAKLEDKFTTIAELFKDTGYETAGFVSNGYISDKWGYTQGFNTFENFIRDNKPNSAAFINKTAFAWVNQLAEVENPETKKKEIKPFYLYLGTSDPHVSYRVHEEYMSQYDKEPYDGLFKNNVSGEELEEIKSKKKKITKRDESRIEAMYENEIAYNDAQFGKMIAFLKEKRIYNDTLVIVSADHGEEFWEHGSCGHGHSLFQELIAVPLLIKWPQSFPAQKINFGVDGTDLVPTLSALLGKPKDAHSQGRNIIPYLKSKNTYPQAILASKGDEKYAISIANTKVIYQSAESISAFHLNKDIAEKKNLIDSNYILTLSGLDPLLLYLSRPRAWQKTIWGAPNALSDQFPKEFPKSWKK